jgi:hypothetical protein
MGRQGCKVNADFQISSLVIWMHSGTIQGDYTSRTSSSLRGKTKEAVLCMLSLRGLQNKHSDGESLTGD